MRYGSPAPAAQGRPLIFRAALAALLGLRLAAGPAAQAQVEAARARNNYLPTGRNLTSAMVRSELEARLARQPDNEAAIWNAGADFFRNYPKNQDTALAIKNGFLTARTTNPGQHQLLTKAAIYWGKIHDYGQGNVPVGQDFNSRQQLYYGYKSKFLTLPPRKPGSSHQGYVSHDWPGRYINRRQPYQGRPDNPYPGRYYPGRYPP